MIMRTLADDFRPAVRIRLRWPGRELIGVASMMAVALLVLSLKLASFFAFHPLLARDVAAPAPITASTPVAAVPGGAGS